MGADMSVLVSVAVAVADPMRVRDRLVPRHPGASPTRIG
jgi:hypothetical protein